MKTILQKFSHPVALSFLLSMFISVNVKAQSSYSRLNFENTEIQIIPGKKLAFTLTNLPDPKKYGNTDGALDVQINWQLGEECEAGSSFSTRAKIKSTTHQFLTDYIASRSDDGKKVRITVSYLGPTGDDDVPAKGLIPATKDCATLKLSKP